MHARLNGLPDDALVKRIELAKEKFWPDDNDDWIFLVLQLTLVPISRFYATETKKHFTYVGRELLLRSSARCETESQQHT